MATDQEVTRLKISASRKSTERSLAQQERTSERAAGPDINGQPVATHPFAHPSEVEFARILDFYGVRWEYEPRSFPLRWEGDRVVEMFTPDFYLPELDLYVELTTLKQSLVTEKNRKLRHLRELHPEINIKLLYRRDYHRLLAKYGFGPLAQAEVRGIERVLFSTNQVEKRVEELGRQISRDYAGLQPILVGVLKGVLCFMGDLMRHISLPLSLEFMSISYFGTNGEMGVRITKDLDRDIRGKPVLVVEDIVDTGMTLNYLLNYLHTRQPASLEVCTLLDKRIRRLVDVPIQYVGFEIPDEFVVGYG
ncbi:MAG: hypoxanthine phosphoribosyltransferase, partial [Chloroflexi bacterium]|nr:hypoxanthine phosphoribosyltransferase [Chloroflexota bacterium]